MSTAQRHHHSARPSIQTAALSLVGGFLGIAAIGLIDQFVLQDNDLTFVIGAFGATAVLVFGAPGSPFAQPWNVIVGHVTSALIGVAVFQLFGAGWFAAALAVSLAIAAMQMSRSLHPPGGASALIAVAGSSGVHDLGFLYPLFPVGAGALVLIGVALVVNNLSAHRPWPIFWY
ncbi:HPP family protein [Sinisalibacter aestuarii]|uniref:Membrane protein n=1 Tax=Sinisalibacter aestuarii TaxID=2949426 RepID=A0ABQ5LV61_9RHOB|nr:HPP family protein [Sinisalibacter aestuarii]GKY88221.1 membrane protein [Sinisalibacter aestuarii]